MRYVRLFSSLLVVVASCFTLLVAAPAPTALADGRAPAECVLRPERCVYKPLQGTPGNFSCPPGFNVVGTGGGGGGMAMCVGVVAPTGGTVVTPRRNPPPPQCTIRNRAFSGADEASLTMFSEKWTRNCAPAAFTLTVACAGNPVGTLMPWSYQLGWDRGYKNTSTITLGNQTADPVNGEFPCDTPVCIGVGCGQPDPAPAVDLVVEVDTPTAALTGGSLRPTDLTATVDSLTCVIAGQEVECPPSAKGPFLGDVVLDINVIAPPGAQNCADPKVCDYYIVSEEQGETAFMTVWFFTATGVGENYRIEVVGTATQTYVRGTDTIETAVPIVVNPGQGDGSFTVKSASAKPK